MESPCAVSLIVVGSFTLFTVGCGCIVDLVLCSLCSWIFALCGVWYCEALVLLVGVSLYRGRTVLYALCMRLLVLSVWWCILHCCYVATAFFFFTAVQNTPPHG